MTEPTANDRLHDWLLYQFQRGEIGGYDYYATVHLNDCPQAATNHGLSAETDDVPPDLEVEITCAHGFTDIARYPAAGDIPGTLEEFDDWQHRQPAGPISA